MNKIIMSLVVAAFTMAGVQAQENKTVKQESTVKRIVTKNGSNITTKEIKNTDIESGEVIVEGNNKTDQDFNEITRKDLSEKVLVDDNEVDRDNESAIAKQKEIQNAELILSKRNQETLAAEKKQEMDKKQIQMKKDLAEREKRLQARPKGMNKLKKD